MKELIQYDFQIEAENKLYDKISERLISDSHERCQILFLSAVASGKTKMISSTMNRIAADYEDVAIFFISPSSAQLHNNAYEEIKQYGWDNLEVLTLEEMVSLADTNNGNVPPKTFTVIGVSSVDKNNDDKQQNRQMRESEKTNFNSISKTNKTRIIAIYDEGHLNRKNQDTVYRMFHPCVEVIVTATGKRDQIEKAKEQLQIIAVDTQQIIEEGKIKNNIIINDAGMNDIDPDSGINGVVDWKELIRAGLHRRDWLENRMNQFGLDIVPILVIQLPNDDTDETNDDANTIKNCDIAKKIVKDLGIGDEDILIWLAGRHDIDPNEIKNTKHKVLIVKVACATGWNCPRAMPLVKLRDKSKSDTLDAQTLGRFMRTYDPIAWQVNEQYHDDEYLNSAFIYTTNEEYDVSITGYSIRDERYVQKMRDKYKPQWEKIRLVSIVPSKKQLGDQNKIVQDMVNAFNKNFPCEYETNGGKWVHLGHADRRIACYQAPFGSVMKDIQEKGKSVTPGHGRADVDDNMIEEAVWTEIYRHNELRHNSNLIEIAINNHIENNLCYNLSNDNKVASFLSMPVDDTLTEQRLKKRNDFFKGIYTHFDLFANACIESINKNIEYKQDEVWDGDDQSEHHMYKPPMETFTGVNLVETDDESNFVYDKHAIRGQSSAEDGINREFLSKKMDSWYKNGTHEKDSFLIAYIDESNRNAHRKFFPDFIAKRGEVLYIIETKGDYDAGGDHSIEPEQDKCKATAIYDWLNKYKTKSVSESDGITDIVFGIARKINGDWKIYQGDGNDYLDTASQNWKLLSEVIEQH